MPRSLAKSECASLLQTAGKLYDCLQPRCLLKDKTSFCNGLPGLATAFADRSPIFCVTSSPPLRDAETNSLQGFHDQVVVAKPITKFAHRVTNVEEIPRLTAYAYRAANSGIKGPVLLDIPIDVLFGPPRIDGISWGAVMMPPAYAPGPDPKALDQLLDMWKKAERPVIITGTGARGLDKKLCALAESTSTPVFYSSKFSTPTDGLTYGHKLRCGAATRLAALKPMGKRQADFVLLLAARTGFLLGGRGGAIIPNDSKLVQVDVDGSEIGKSLPVALGIASDAELFCDAFLEKVKDAKIEQHGDWVSICADIGKARPFEKDPKVQSDGQLHPWHAFNAVMHALPQDSIIMVDGGEAGQWAAMTLDYAKPKSALVSTGYLGFLGNGWGYSLGAAVADPSRLVVNIHGDGSAGFHIQELDTYARFGLNVLTIISNNYFWGMSVNGQDLVYEGKTKSRPAVELSKACAYEIVAQGFNCNGAKVEKFEDIEPTVKKLSTAGRPGLINMIVSRTPTTPATKSMVEATDDPNVIVVPYYDNVPRPYFKNSDTPQVNGQANGH